jgi:DNA-directed RNA polymerase subunit E'/Rpb7
MNNPYITTYLTSYVRILPREMDNNIRKYIKSSLEKEHVNKCFNDYGFITKVHEIEIIGDGKIIPEDPMCCASFNIRFLCTLCRPLNNSIIVAKIVGMSEQLIFLSYGPLEIIVKTINSINKNIFVFNQNLSRWTVKKSNDKDEQQKFIVLKNDSYLKVKIVSKKIVDKTKQIICMGFIENIASDKEIETSIKDMYEPKKYDSIDEFIDLENKIQESIRLNAETANVESDVLSDNDI